jgi:hypothetical protein
MTRVSHAWSPLVPGLRGGDLRIARGPVRKPLLTRAPGMQVDKITRVRRAHTRELAGLTHLSALGLSTLEQPTHTREHIARLTGLTRLLLGALRPVDAAHLALLQQLPDLLDLALTYSAPLPRAAVAAIAGITTIRFLNLVPLELEHSAEDPSLTDETVQDLAPMTQLLSLKLTRNSELGCLIQPVKAFEDLGYYKAGSGCTREDVHAVVAGLSEENRRELRGLLGFLQSLLGMVLLQYLDISGLGVNDLDALAFEVLMGFSERVIVREDIEEPEEPQPELGGLFGM